MKVRLLTLIILLVLGLIVDIYLYTVLKRSGKHPLLTKIHKWSSIALTLSVIGAMFFPFDRLSSQGIRIAMWVVYSYLTIYLPKYVIFCFTLISQLPFLRRKKASKGIIYIGVVAAIALFGTMWWGALINRHNIEVERIDIALTNHSGKLQSFKGYKMVHISDMHVGTWGNDTTFVSALVDSINALQPDVVLFTGDIVNARSEEAIPFIGTLSRLKAKDGVYAVLGNHDYGDYAKWDNYDAITHDRNQLRKYIGEMGWQLLDNTHTTLTRGNDSILLLGVGNITPDKPENYGNIDMAYNGCDANTPKILMSHNPEFWYENLRDNDAYNIDLTLSGHTHAMQMSAWGISPAIFLSHCPQGLYQDSKGHKLNVNIGCGTVGIPTRIGATPQITLITLND